MTTFDEREQAFENKFKHDEELQFRIFARRAKLIGLWAAGHLGLDGEDAAGYARQIVDVDFAEPGHRDILRRIHEDFQAKGVDISEHRIEKEMEILLEEARRQIYES
ncbi:DUF1476 domain-containing protein [Rhodospirillum centenum]|uniref:DUF1476 domain-containing protein n=1 Tax=Rhodospirillum centenum (strain ATCC 51521 / SW) TaxID=414684 RepID=B6IUI8_RHOCS|nr:DUF1476 domain-containing protein [Rhodospirillum centenum]ACI99813.1 conserved hypothetical protein [Rhodospirillum centenum SW]